jgi:SAM-dependent methyltransferase
MWDRLPWCAERTIAKRRVSRVASDPSCRGPGLSSSSTSDARGGPRNSSVYIHGTTSEEQRRLSVLNSLLNDPCLHELSLHGNERILDVGCGLGHFSRLMARTTGQAVVGVERSGDQIQAARGHAAQEGESHLLDLRQGDALDLPLREEEWGSFDLAHARFLLEHVPDPAGVVAAMVRAVRPGGRVVLADDDHDLLRLWPEPPGVLQLWQAYIRSYDRLGNDPFVGRRLAALLHGAGARPVRNMWIFFGSCAGSALFPAVVRNLSDILQGARAVILETSHTEGRAFDRALEALAEWGTLPDAAFWFATCWAEGRRERQQ